MHRALLTGLIASLFLALSALGQGTIIFPPFPPFPEMPPETAPINNAFTNALPLNGASITLSGATLQLATAEAGEPAHGGQPAFRSVWYRWTAQYRGEVDLRLTSSTVLGIGIYKGSQLTSLTTVDRTHADTNHARWMAEPSEQFVFAVNEPGSSFSGGAIFNLRLTHAGLKLAKPFERIGKVGVPIPLQFDSWDSNNVITRIEARIGTNLVGSITNLESTLTWTPQFNGDLTLTATATTADGLVLHMVPQQFFIKPANDAFAEATPLPALLPNNYISFSSAGSTFEPGEPDYSTNLPPTAGSLWWKWQPQHTAATYLGSSDSLFVFEGDDLQNLTLVATSGPVTIIIRAWNSGPGTTPAAPRPPDLTSYVGKTYWFSAVTTNLNAYFTVAQRLHWLEAVNGSVGYAQQPFALKVSGVHGALPPPAITLHAFRYTLDPIFQFGSWESVRSFNLTNAPNFEFSWIPEEPGIYELRAAGTYASGEIWSRTLPVTVNAQNDAREFAPLISGLTNFTFRTDFATADLNEPVFGTNVVGRTVWWRWRSETNAQVRFSAPAQSGGLPLEIFTESNGTLTRVAHNEGRAMLPPLEGIVWLNAQAGVDYLVRVTDPFFTAASWIRYNPLFTSPRTFNLQIVDATAPLRGLILLSTILGTPDDSGEIDWQTYARVLLPNGSPATNFNYRAQFYIGDSPDAFQKIGPAVFINTQPGTGDPGGVSAGLRDALVSAGTKLWVQLRAWDANFGATYEAARLFRGPTGRSEILELTAGSEQFGPTTLTNLNDVIIGTIANGFTPGELRPAGISISGKPQFELRASRGFLYSVDASANGTTWEPLLLLTNGTGSIQFNDPRPNAPAATMFRTRVID